MLARKPAFTVVAVLTLALGIGANTAIFTVVDATLIRSLPYKNSEKLVQLWETRQAGAVTQLDASYPDYLDWGGQSDAFEEICGYTGWGGSFTLTGHDTPERIEGARVTTSFFSVLGVEPILGRSFLPDEDLPGTEQTVIHELCIVAAEVRRRPEHHRAKTHPRRRRIHGARGSTSKLSIRSDGAG